MSQRGSRGRQSDLPALFVVRWGFWMNTDRLRTAARAIIRSGRPDVLAGAIAGLGGAGAIGSMEWFSLAAHYPLAVIPFSTSILLVIGAPEAVPAQPPAPIRGPPLATPGRP